MYDFIFKEELFFNYNVKLQNKKKIKVICKIKIKSSLINTLFKIYKV